MANATAIPPSTTQTPKTNSGLEEEVKKTNKLLEGLKNFAKPDKEKIQNQIQVIKEKALTPSVAAAKKGFGVAGKGLGWVLRTPTAMILIVLIAMYGLQLLDIVLRTIGTVSPMLAFIYGDSVAAYLGLLLTLFLYSTLIFWLFNGMHTKPYKWIRTIFLILITITLIWGGISAKAGIGGKTVGEEFSEIGENNKKSFFSVWTDISKCNFHLDNECMRAERNTQEVEVNDRAVYELDYDLTDNREYYMAEDKISTRYRFKTTELLEIIGFSCAEVGKEPFFTKTFSEGDETYFEKGKLTAGKSLNYECENLASLELDEDKEFTEKKIEIVLNYRTNAQLTYKIPIIDFNKLVEENPEINPEEDNQKYELVEYYEDLLSSKDYETSFPELPLGVKESKDDRKELLPIISGNEEIQSSDIKITFFEKNSGYGTFKSGQVTGVNSQPQILEITKGENERFSLFQENDDGTKSKEFFLGLREKSGIQTNQIKTIGLLTIKLDLEFEKKTSEKIKIENPSYVEDVPTANG